MCLNLQYCINQKINQLIQKLCTNIKYKQRKIKNSEKIRKPVMDIILIGCILNIAKMQKMSSLINSPLFFYKKKLFVAKFLSNAFVTVLENLKELNLLRLVITVFFCSTLFYLFIYTCARKADRFYRCFER